MLLPLFAVDCFPNGNGLANWSYEGAATEALAIVAEKSLMGHRGFYYVEWLYRDGCLASLVPLRMDFRSRGFSGKATREGV